MHQTDFEINMAERQQEILDACKNGNRLAQRQLYEHFKGKMFAVCMRYANNRQDAEDLLQEGFVKVFRDLHQYKGLGSLEGWIRRVVLHVALQYIRRQKKTLQTTDLESLSFQIGEEDPVVFEEGDNARSLVKLMQKLPAGFRTVLNLYVLEGFTHPQIAEELGITVGTSKSQLNRAKAYLKSLLEKSLAG
jgi:RNA polymerase sigma-70 factor (ECF subfamily)